jgi:hypothetical protein
MYQLMLAVVAAIVAALCVHDSWRRPGVSNAVWIVVLWAVLLGTRPVSSWIDNAQPTAKDYDDGSLVDSLCYMYLLAHALVVTRIRKVPLGPVMRTHPWLFVLLLFWAVSAIWSDVPVVTFKRWVKEAGNIVMVLVVVSEAHPIDAIKAVFVRCACITMPVSLLLIRYFPNLGRTYHPWTGDMMYTGMATHKNSLGALALVCSIFIVWDLLERSGQSARKDRGRLTNVSLLVISVWLLVIANSSTAFACAGVAVGAYLLLRRATVRRNVRAFEVIFVLVAVLAWAMNVLPAAINFFVGTVLSRDPTLTTRTDVWPLLISLNDHPLLGAGFNSFWSGERLASLYGQLGIIQAHNGYLETYLNGGVIGLSLLVLVLWSALKTANKRSAEGSMGDAMSLVVLLIVITYNFTEAAFNKMSVIWFAFLLVIVAARPKCNRNAPMPLTGRGQGGQLSPRIGRPFRA